MAALSRIISFAIAPVVMGWPYAAAAGPPTFDLAIAPTYTFCVGGNPPCSSAGRASVALEFKPVAGPKHDWRISLSRAYVQSIDTDSSIDVASNQGYQAAADSLDARLRLYDDGGYEREEPRFGYAYQYGVGSSTAYHTTYASDSWFFGRRIRRGSESPARQFRVLLKFSENVYQASGSLPQSFAQVTPYVTFPLEPSGVWRTEAAYTVQQQVGGPGRLTNYATGFSASVTHDFSDVIRGYIKAESTLSTSLSGSSPASLRATTLVLGCKITLK
jgi:hypothetical protein